MASGGGEWTGSILYVQNPRKKIDKNDEKTKYKLGVTVAKDKEGQIIPDKGDPAKKQDKNALINHTLKIDKTDLVKNIFVYKSPMKIAQKKPVPGTLVHHEFIVLETHKNRWWSFDKTKQGIVLQHDDGSKDVIQWKNGARRDEFGALSILSFDNADKGISVNAFLDFLMQKELTPDHVYHGMRDNCQSFAARMFDRFAEKKKHVTGLGPISPKKFSSGEKAVVKSVKGKGKR